MPFSYPKSLTAGTAENVNDLNANLNYIASQFPIAASNLATGIVLQLGTTGTARKIAFGKTQLTWAGTNFSTQLTIPHGLGVTPQVVIPTCGPPGGPTQPFIAYQSANADGTNIYITGWQPTATGSSGNTQNLHWLAIG